MKQWKPTPLEIMQALLFVLCDEPVRSDALYVFGSQGDELLDAEELKTAANLYLNGFAPKIVINGISAYKSRELNMAYIGYESWLLGLMNCGADKKDILFIPPSLHTAEESLNILVLSEKMDWKTLTIMSAPHHQLRCFLTIISLMKDRRTKLEIHNRTFGYAPFDWSRDMTKLVLSGKMAVSAGNVNGNMEAHISAEFERIVKYAQYWEPDDAPYTRHATIPEMFEYLKKRGTD